MRYLAVDDEYFMTEEIRTLLKEISPDADVRTYTSPARALEALAQEPADVAFLDIEIGGRYGAASGLELAVRMKQIQPDIHIVFVTGYHEYAVKAFQIHATGYLLKPIVKEDLQRELTFIYSKENRKKIRIQTFGGFDIFVNGSPLKFSRTKAKELLAYLVDCRGASVTTAEAYSVLFEHGENTESGKTYMRNIIRSLKQTLEAAEAGDILVRRFNFIAIVPDLVDCDYFRFLQGDAEAINQYRGDYMPQYSWAEIRNGEFTERQQHRE